MAKPGAKQSTSKKTQIKQQQSVESSTDDSSVQSSRLNAPVTSDGRFSKLFNNPRFERIAQNKRKVSVDQRFSRMFSGEEFTTETPIDKYGRPISHSTKENLKKYYQLERQPEQPTIPSLSSSSSSDSEQDELTQSPHSFEDTSDFITQMELQTSSSDDEDDQLSSDDSADQSDVEHTDSLEIEKEDVPEGEETRRFAVLGCDWDKIRAVDLLVLFQSFLPPVGIGYIEKVSIYPSQFGKERMKVEEIYGPVGIWQEGTDPSNAPVDEEKLREYELNRLKYYYAVVECDSKQTALQLYQQCDGLEVESTANLLDLRFIPDDTEFEDDPREFATEVPPTYKSPRWFTRALQTSKVELTWDEDPEERKVIRNRKFTKDQLRDLDLKAYLESESDEEDLRVPQIGDQDGIELDSSDEEDESEDEGEDEGEQSEDEEEDIKLRDAKVESKRSKLRQKYAALLEGLESREEKRDALQITFSTGLSDSASAFDRDDFFAHASDSDGDDIDKEIVVHPSGSVSASNSKSVDKTVWDEYLEKRQQKIRLKRQEKRQQKREEERKKKEEELAMKKLKKRNKKRNKRKDGQLSDDQDEDDGSGLSADQRAKRRAELELLTIDSNAKPKGLHDESVSAESTVKDPRFGALFTSHDFDLDPTHPRFKKTKVTEKILEERRKRKDQRASDQNQSTQNQTSKSDQIDVRSLAESVKRKSEALLKKTEQPVFDQPPTKRRRF